MMSVNERTSQARDNKSASVYRQKHVDDQKGAGQRTAQTTNKEAWAVKSAREMISQARDEKGSIRQQNISRQRRRHVRAEGLHVASSHDVVLPAWPCCSGDPPMQTLPVRSLRHFLHVAGDVTMWFLLVVDTAKDCLNIASDIARRGLLNHAMS